MGRTLCFGFSNVAAPRQIYLLMNLRRLVTFIIIILLIAIFRPSGFWRELKRIWDQRELITRVLTTLILLYLVYGLYELYTQGWFEQWFGN